MLLWSRSPGFAPGTAPQSYVTLNGPSTSLLGLSSLLCRSGNSPIHSVAFLERLSKNRSGACHTDTQQLKTNKIHRKDTPFSQYLAKT